MVDECHRFTDISLTNQLADNQLTPEVDATTKRAIIKATNNDGELDPPKRAQVDLSTCIRGH